MSEQAIFVEADVFEWNVLSDVSNSNLVEKIILAKSSNPQTLLLISNFNAFLEKENKKKQANPQLMELFKYCSGSMNAAVWIEPNMNPARLGLFPWITKQLEKLVRFAKLPAGDQPNQSASSKFAVPIRPYDTVSVRLCVMPIDLIKSGEHQSASD